MVNKTLCLIASKLGLGDDDKVLNKAEEFQRLLQTKSTAGSILTDTSKVVICLDLAAGLLGANLDVKSAIKYSGLKPSAYNNTKKVVENLLELNTDKLTTTMLCVTLQCNVQELADKILEEYQKQAKMDVDLNLPQYVCMAVYQACRINKVKIAKSKIVEKSRLKPAQWAKLDADWTKFTDMNFAAAIKKKGRQPKNKVDNADPAETMEIDVPKLEENPQEIIESYKDWKKRMLDTAYQELKELEKFETKSVTPRKSPRKSVKFSPYKSPSKAKSNGVRLLFPLDL